MSDLPSKLCEDVNVTLDENTKLNCLLWADDIILLSETEDGLNKLLDDLRNYSEQNHLKINTKKTKCMIFNKTGRLIHRNFYLGDRKLENVRSYKYLGLIVRGVYLPKVQFNMKDTSHKISKLISCLLRPCNYKT